MFWRWQGPPQGRVGRAEVPNVSPYTSCKFDNDFLGDCALINVSLLQVFFLWQLGQSGRLFLTHILVLGAGKQEFNIVGHFPLACHLGPVLNIERGGCVWWEKGGDDKSVIHPRGDREKRIRCRLVKAWQGESFKERDGNARPVLAQVSIKNGQGWFFFSFF